jgi:hypothetical protein
MLVNNQLYAIFTIIMTIAKCLNLQFKFCMAVNNNAKNFLKMKITRLLQN